LRSDEPLLGTEARLALEHLRDDEDIQVSSAAAAALTVRTTSRAASDTNGWGQTPGRPLHEEASSTGAEELEPSHRRARRRMRRWRSRPRFLLELSSVLVGAVALIVAIAVLAPRQAQAEVPSLAGDDTEAATDRLKRSELAYQIRMRSDKAPEGRVVATDPPAGTRLSRGAVVIVYVSSGPKTVAVPKVKGKKADDAKRLLRDAGFLVKEIAVKDASEKDGTAIGTDPPAGTDLAEGSTVKLKLSASGKPLPDLAGQSVPAAEQTLRNLGLDSTIRREWSREVVAGRVIVTSPRAGQRVPKGTTVEILASLGPEPTASTTRTPPPPTTPTPTTQSTPTTEEQTTTEPETT
jgi:eukaryotic-like serine/threonine-protein kinase